MLPVAPRPGLAVAVGAVVWALTIGGCGPATPPPAPTPPTATAAELASATAAADKALNDGRVDDALTLARFVAERDRSGKGHELLGRVWLVRASQAEQASDSAAATSARAAAAEAYRKAADADPSNAALQDAAGMVVDMIGDRYSAAAYYSKAIDLDGTNPAYRLHRGNAHLRNRQVNLARIDARALLAMAPNEAWTNALCAEVEIAELQPTLAIPYAERARELAPRDITFRVLHARALRANQQTSDAVELLMALPETERGARSVAAELAEGWCAMHRPEKAAEAWELAYRTAPQHEKLPCALAAGDARIKAGDRPGAKSWLDIAALLAPNDPQVEALSKALATSNGGG